MRKRPNIFSTLALAALAAVLTSPLSTGAVAASTLTDLDCVDGTFIFDISGATSITEATVSKSNPAQTVSFEAGSLTFADSTLTIVPNDSEYSKLESFGYSEMSFSVVTNDGTVTGGCND